MKRLILVRHGKSSWKYDVQDHERPLKKRAFKDAEVIVKTLKHTVEGPFVIWTSFATRAMESAEIFKDLLQVKDEDFLVTEALYTFDCASLLKEIRSCDDSVENLMVFGHNPAITKAVNSLGDRYFDNIPTTGLSVIDFETVSWKQLKNGKTILYLFPKNLK